MKQSFQETTVQAKLEPYGYANVEGRNFLWVTPLDKELQGSNDCWQGDESGSYIQINKTRLSRLHLYIFVLTHEDILCNYDIV